MSERRFFAGLNKPIASAVSAFAVIAALSAVFTLVPTLVTDKTYAVILGTILFFFMLFCGVMIYAQLECLERIEASGSATRSTASETGVELEKETTVNGDLPPENLRRAYELLEALNPCGAALEIMSPDGRVGARIPIYLTAISAGITALGAFLFGQKDLK